MQYDHRPLLQIARDIVAANVPGISLYRVKELKNLHRAAYAVIVKRKGSKVGRAFCSIIL